jgi:hypothetical protein
VKGSAPGTFNCQGKDRRTATGRYRAATGTQSPMSRMRLLAGVIRVLVLPLLVPSSAFAQAVRPTRLHVLPTTHIVAPHTLAIEFGQTTTFGGGIAGGGGGTGNQTYQGWGEFGINSRLMLTLFFDSNDDPTFGLVSGRRWLKEYATFGAGARVVVSDGGGARFAVEGSLSRFGMISEAGLFTSDSTFRREYFTTGTLAAIASATFARGWRATIAPSATYLPSERDGVPFFGWTTLLGMGIDGEIHRLIQVFATSELPLGPGNNALRGNFEFERTPLWSVGSTYIASPKIQLTAFLTNQSGGTPSTRHLPLIGEIPTQYGVRARWTPMSPDRVRPVVEAHAGSQSVLGSLGGLQTPGPHALTEWTLDASLAIDNAGSRSGSFRLGLSDELDFEVGFAWPVDLQSLATLGIDLDDGTHYRLGSKLTLVSEDWGSPATVSIRLSGGQDAESHRGYFMAEALVGARVHRWAEVTLAPVVAQNGATTPAALGISGVLGSPGGFQLILEPTLLLTNQSSLWTAGVRFPAWSDIRPHVFVTTARSMLGIGRLLGDPKDPRAGAMVRIRLW